MSRILSAVILVESSRTGWRREGEWVGMGGKGGVMYWYMYIQRRGKKGNVVHRSYDYICTCTVILNTITPRHGFCRWAAIH